MTYGVSRKANFQISNIRYKNDYSLFDLKYRNIKRKNKIIKNINLKLLGKHNVLNATAAITVCLNLGVSEKIIKKSLKNFSGVQRRMTKIFSRDGNDFFDDYAHHPTEIKSILDGIKNVNSSRKIISVFEPHRYSRVISLKNAFAKSFLKSDLVILCPIYAAGERKNKKYNHLNFANLISKLSKVQVIVIKNQYELKKYLQRNLISNELIIGMGAGSISKWMRELK